MGNRRAILEVLQPLPTLDIRCREAFGLQSILQQFFAAGYLASRPSKMNPSHRLTAFGSTEAHG
jgi:hypothetical protein